MTDLEKLAEKMTRQDLLELLGLKWQEHMELARKHEALAKRYANMIAGLGEHAQAPTPKRGRQGKRRPGRPKGSRNKKNSSVESQAE